MSRGFWQQPLVCTFLQCCQLSSCHYHYPLLTWISRSCHPRARPPAPTPGSAAHTWGDSPEDNIDKLLEARCYITSDITLWYCRWLAPKSQPPNPLWYSVKTILIEMRRKIYWLKTIIFFFLLLLFSNVKCNILVNFLSPLRFVQITFNFYFSMFRDNFEITWHTVRDKWEWEWDVC